MNQIIEELTDINYDLCCNLKKYIFLLKILDGDMNMFHYKKVQENPNDVNQNEVLRNQPTEVFYRKKRS